MLRLITKEEEQEALNEATALVDVMGLLYEADYRQQLIEEVATGLILESIKKERK